MKPNQPTPNASGNSAEGRRSVRRLIQIAACLVGLLCLGTLVSVFLSTQPQTSSPESLAQPETSPSAAMARPSVGSAHAVSASAVAPSARAHFPEPEPAMRQLVDKLVNLEAPDGVWTDELTAAWKQKLQQLIQQGAAGVPAI